MNKKGMSLVALLIGLIIIAVMSYTAFRTAQKPDTSTKNFVEEKGIDASSRSGVLNSSKKIIQDAQSTRENPL